MDRRGFLTGVGALGAVTAGGLATKEGLARGARAEGLATPILTTASGIPWARTALPTGCIRGAHTDILSTNTHTECAKRPRQTPQAWSVKRVSPCSPVALHVRPRLQPEGW